VVGAVVPASIAVAGGEQLSGTRAAGVAVAIVAIVLIALPRRAAGAAGTHRHLRRSHFLLAVTAGLGFAGFFLFLHASADAGGQAWWPMLVIRTVGLTSVVVGVGVVAAVGRRADGLDNLRASLRELGAVAVLPVFLLAGAGDLGGNLFFLFADQNDALSAAVVLSSLYPVVTALLAVVVLRERLSPAQWSGVGLAAAAAGLIGIG
jgi:drug/metabolite transporter (DMT)-like permease